jgi:hypothetical protein
MNAWQASELQQALREADKGVFISHESMLAWVDSLGGDNERAPPEPDLTEDIHKPVQSPGDEG